MSAVLATLLGAGLGLFGAHQATNDQNSYNKYLYDTYKDPTAQAILSADAWVCIFVLFVLWMRHPAQGATGEWVMPGLIFKRFPLWEFSLFDNP